MNPTIHADSAPKPVGNYPHARRVGNLLFLSGIGPRNPANNEVPGNELYADGRVRRYDMVAQTHAVFARVVSRADGDGSRRHGPPG